MELYKKENPEGANFGVFVVQWTNIISFCLRQLYHMLFLFSIYKEIERQAGEELFKQLKSDIKAIIEVECWKNETPEELFQWLYNKYNF